MSITHSIPTPPRRPGPWTPSLGAWPEDGGTRFRVWSPESTNVELLVERAGAPTTAVPLARGDDGTFSALVPGVTTGDRYRYRVDGEGPFPDPASRYQPEGVHGPSEVVDPGRFVWTDREWRGIARDELVIYELHVGTFSPEGTFAGAAERLPQLAQLGVTAIELLPLADFAGERSWGYDGVALYAPARSYGTPDDLRRLVDAAHRLGIAVLLDVVYNHFGPVGNYTLAFSKFYLSTTRSSAWAACVNLDGEQSDMVNAFFIENALHWLHEYHLDGLRLDATHSLHDDRDPNFLQRLVDEVHASGLDRPAWLIAEDHRNLDAMVRPREEGGWGLDGVWADDFHHQVRRLLAGDHEGYYADYSGTADDLAATIEQGWYYTGQYSAHLDERRGTDSAGLEPDRFVTCLQNHDQVGNRAMGDRLHHEIEPAAYRAATALLLCTPHTPLLFMGQEWAASAPFRYFTDHDAELGHLVTEGRRREFRHFRAFADPEARERIPDPQARSTFEASRLDWSERDREPHASTLRLHERLLHLRRREPALRCGPVGGHSARALGPDSILLRRSSPNGPDHLLVARLRGAGAVDLPPETAPAAGAWEVVLTTEDPSFAPDPTPPTLEPHGEGMRVRFERPSAILLRARA